ncbi:MAG TPA: hypothetical protein P5081_02065 [Phycisphaerae bacterium]|nr:hypothetical protein [Phycisphaerae bacterium]
MAIVTITFAAVGLAIAGGLRPHTAPSDATPSLDRRELDTRLAPAPQDGDESDGNSRNASMLDRALAAIRRGDFAEAEKLIHEGRKIRSTSKKDKWRIVEARLEFERGDFAKAGLRAMEIVILRENSDEVGQALYWAGRAYEGLGRPNKAIELYEDCRNHKTTPADQARAVARRIEQLRGSDKS